MRLQPYLITFCFLFTFQKIAIANDESAIDSENIQDVSSRSLVGSYWLGFGVSHSSGNGVDGLTLAMSGNLAVHANVSLQLGFEYFEGEFDGSITEMDGFGGDLGITLHNRVDMGEISVDPFVSFGTGFASIDYTNLLFYSYAGNFLAPASYTVIPINFSVGSEFLFSNFFSLIPQIGVTGWLNDDGLDLDATFDYRLAASFFINDNFSMTFLLGGNSDSVISFGYSSRFHF